MNKIKIMAVCSSDPVRADDLDITKSICSVCALEIYLSASTVRAFGMHGHKKEDLTLYCLGCSVEAIEKEKPVVIEYTEEQKRELQFQTGARRIF